MFAWLVCPLHQLPVLHSGRLRHVHSNPTRGSRQVGRFLNLTLLHCTCSESVATLRRFMDTRSAAGWGAVANAFAAGLRQLLSEWALFTAQLEHRALCGALPLQVIHMTFRSLLEHFQMHLPRARTMAALSRQGARTRRCQIAHAEVPIPSMAACRMLMPECKSASKS
jgi:Gamma tubulin complex component N-terminal